jgi:hypothetical protein
LNQRSHDRRHHLRPARRSRHHSHLMVGAQPLRLSPPTRGRSTTQAGKQSVRRHLTMRSVATRPSGRYARMPSSEPTTAGPTGWPSSPYSSSA